MKTRTIATVLALLPLLLLPGRAEALMNLRPGDAPPPFVLSDLTGKQVGSEALAGAPSVVLFWSTWSPRSGEMLDDFKRHAAAYGGKGLKIVAINIDGENLGAAQKAAIREYAVARDLPFPVLLDEDLRTFSSWGIMAHPTEVVLDAGGRIAYVLPGYPLSLREELEEEIKKALGVPAVHSGKRPRRSASCRRGWRCSSTTSAASSWEKATPKRRSRPSGGPRTPTPASSRPAS